MKIVIHISEKPYNILNSNIWEARYGATCNAAKTYNNS